MSTHPHSTDEERALDEIDQRKADLMKEFRHTKAGVWDVYEHIPHGKFGVGIPRALELPRGTEIMEDLPFAGRLVNDVIQIEACRYYLFLLLLLDLLGALQPAGELWFMSYYFAIVQAALDERRVDEKLIIFASSGLICCRIIGELLAYWGTKVKFPLQQLVEEHTNKEMFGTMAHLDLPTFDDESVKATLRRVERVPYQGNVIWRALSVAQVVLSSIICFVAQLGVLAKVIGNQRDKIAFAVVYIGLETYELIRDYDRGEVSRIAITSNEHYVKLPGFEALVKRSKHRQEIVAGNCGGCLEAVYNQTYALVSGKRAEVSSTLVDLRTSCLRRVIRVIFPGSLKHVAEAGYLLKSAAHPESIPACIVTLFFVRSIIPNIAGEFIEIPNGARFIKEQFGSVRQFYKIREIKNKVPDGGISFPEDSQSLVSGITVEFRNVSFRYPNVDTYALQDVSFKIEKGQLCVIVGTNGSGKSTLLKLILRLYDPTEGSILVDGQDIRTLKLADLRESMAALFQDYTHFPLSIKNNIALGDPQNAHDETRIREAARLGGAEEFIDKMPEGFNTYLERPVSNHWDISSDTQMRSGMKFDRNLFREAIGYVGTDEPIGLSGGEMQRLAVSRSFMRSVVSERGRVGLLLFDEPSAALDPVAEHDLFTRLQKLRGEKTMIFSSHRFGQLTKPADLILCMDKARVVESGTHSQLLAQAGKYAEMWELQVGGFF